MKIACILGSPRAKGNSATIAQAFLAAAEKNGATVETFPLNGLVYKGCQSCMACKTTQDACAVQDALTPVLEAVRAADILVMTSAVYMAHVTGQLKSFIDRTYSFLKPDYLTTPNPSRLAPGKKAVFILTQGAPDEKMFADIQTKMEHLLTWYGFEKIETIRGLGLAPTPVVQIPEAVRNRAVAVAQDMTRS